MRCISVQTGITLLLISTFLSACTHEVASPWQPADYHTHHKKSRYGNPDFYHANGKTYHVLSSAAGYRKRGIASWYGPKFDGRLTSTREVFDMYGITAASPELPIPCFVRVTNLRNHRSLIVKVNDRGPFAHHRLIDLSYGAARMLGYTKKGTTPVLVESLEKPLPTLEPLPQNLSSDTIYWQTGVFSQYSHAARQRQRLNSRFHKRLAHISREEKNGHSLYRVTLGPLHSLQESDKLYSKLKQYGFSQAIPLMRGNHGNLGKYS